MSSNQSFAVCFVDEYQSKKLMLQKLKMAWFIIWFSKQFYHSDL